MSLASSLMVFFTAGLVGGLLLGLIGVGMALVTVPLLALTLPIFGIGPDIAPLTALATSMAIVAVGSISSIVSHNRLGNVDWGLVTTTVPASLVGVGLGSLVASHLPGAYLKWIFCLFLIIIAIRMLLPTRQGKESEVPATGPWTYRLAGATIGIAGSLIGAGGGVFMVPFLNSRGHTMVRGVATSTTIGMPVSLVGAIIYACEATPVHNGAMLGYIYLPAFFGLSVGSVVAAPMGAKLASKVPAQLLKRSFAVLLIILAIRIITE